MSPRIAVNRSTFSQSDARMRAYSESPPSDGLVPWRAWRTGRVPWTDFLKTFWKMLTCHRTLIKSVAPALIPQPSQLTLPAIL